MTNNWDESKHPRDDEGKFTFKNGGSVSGGGQSDEEKMKNRAELLYPSMEEKAMTNPQNSITQNREDILFPTMNHKEKTSFTGGAANMPVDIENSLLASEKDNADNFLLKGSVTYSDISPSEENFKNSMNVVFKHEGGFSDDPDDLGGRTNMGITQTTYNDYCRRHGLQAKDVKDLTKEEAIKLYYDDYWRASGADKIDNPAGALILFDTAVLHGVGRAKQFYKLANGDFNKMIELRKEFYAKRVQNNPSQKKFLKGWNNRADNLSNILKEYENKELF